MNAEALPTVDGRRARRDQNRESVVDALLDLYREGDLQPSVGAVAERSGVSHRSVFRYFEDLEELYRVAIQRQYESLTEALRISEIGQGTLERRVDVIVEKRLELWDLAANVFRVGHMKAPVEPVLFENHQLNLARTHLQIERHFAPELDAMEPARREAVAEALVVAVAMETMEMLRFTRELSREQAGETMRTMLMGLLNDG